MRRLLYLYLLLALPGWSQAWKVGLNFRATSNYVTDGDDETYSLGTETTSTERKTANGNSITFQWDSALSNSDEESGADRRLAGLVLWNAVKTLTITLPYTGNYLVRMAAIGQHSYANNTGLIYLKDNGTLKLTVDAVPVSANYWVDASNTIRAEAAWPGSNTAVSVNFATTTCQLVLSEVSQWTLFSHLYLEYVPASTRRMWRFVQ